jgi:DNA polymerase III epsilon subunit-like protein
MAKAQYSRYHPGKFGLCIDWETSGSDFGGDSAASYQGVSFGAIIFNTETFEPVETLYRELQFDDTKYKWSDGAQKIHGLSREHLAANGVSREEGLADLLDLILRYIGAESKIFFLGHNVDFDIDFTLQLARDFNVTLVPHHVKLETSGAAFIAIGKYKSDEVFEFFCGQTRAAHNALDDAGMALEVVRNMRAIFDAQLKEDLHVKGQVLALQQELDPFEGPPF